MEGVQNFPLGDGLTPADHPAIGGVLLDQFGPLGGGELLEPDPPPLAEKVRLFFQWEPGVFQQFHQIFRDGGGRREARRADPRRIHKAVFFLEDEVAGLSRMGPHPRKVADGLPKGHRGHRFESFLPDEGQPLGGGGGVFSHDRAGVGAHDQVAVDGGADQNALAVLVGALKDGAAHPATLGLVQQVIFAPAGPDGKFMGRGHVVDRIGTDSRRVDEIPGRKVPQVGVDEPEAAGLFDAGDLGFQVQFGPVPDGGFRQGQAVLPGGADGGGGGVEGGQHLFREVGLSAADFLPREDLQPRHPVGLAPGF